jgi:hypothetical protein
MEINLEYKEDQGFPTFIEDIRKLNEKRFKLQDQSFAGIFLLFVGFLSTTVIQSYVNFKLHRGHVFFKSKKI